jgi:hypothetical protein
MATEFAMASLNNQEIDKPVNESIGMFSNKELRFENLTGRPMAYIKAKAIPLTGREGPYGCETSRLSHVL